MKWKPGTTWLLLLSAWAGLAVWQTTEYRRIRTLAYDELDREAQAVNRALIGGIRTHRGMGRFFEENLQEAVDDVVASETVVAAAIETDDGERLASAGRQDLLDADERTCREASAFAFRDQFKVQSQAGRPRDTHGQSPRGRGPGWLRAQEDERDSASADERGFRTVLLLDATPTEARCRREALLRGLVVAAGSLVLVCVAFAWRATLRATDARGRARLLESEARNLRDLSQAAAGLAHETRNPLSLIRGWTQRLGEHCPDSPEHREKAQAIVEECDRVTARINQFLSFARPSDPEIETFAAGELVDELAVLLEPVLDAKGLRLDRRGVGPDDEIRADREMFRQALFNMLQNAVQSSPTEAEIEIAIRRGPTGRKRVEVSDRGCGVPNEAVESLFTPYFTTRPDGTGLGLAIVRRIAAAHGWQAGYTPRSGGGSVFWLDRVDG
jgi:two-component system sensor histidine kinase HydH